ncbi:MAG: hypothetical protein WCI05_07710 [Myxococcales bacterium]
MGPRREWPEPAALAAGIGRRDRSSVAAALNLLDDRRPEARRRASELCSLLVQADITAHHMVGLTGPPGSGKSSLSAALLRTWRVSGRTVGVLAVDPSSHRTGGALLGDRIRMLQASNDDGVFIRSLASRGELGGLSAEVWPMSIVMLAAFDVVLVETVGIGQSEIDVSQLADSTCYVVQPASGDTIQFLKSGIMEVPHVFAVNKADLGAVAERTTRELKSAIPRMPDGDWALPVVLVSAATGRGIQELAAHFDAHHAFLSARGTLAAQRRVHQAMWIMKRLAEEFGSFGIERLGGTRSLTEQLTRTGASPFALHEELRQLLISAYSKPV